MRARIILVNLKFQNKIREKISKSLMDLFEIFKYKIQKYKNRIPIPIFLTN